METVGTHTADERGVCMKWLKSKGHTLEHEFPYGELRVDSENVRDHCTVGRVIDSYGNETQTMPDEVFV